MLICPLMPRIRPSSSSLKPFITEVTIISVATPSAMPIKANEVMTEINPSLRLARRYLPATIFSNFEKNIGKLLISSKISAR